MRLCQLVERAIPPVMLLVHATLALTTLANSVPWYQLATVDSRHTFDEV